MTAPSPIAQLFDAVADGYDAQGVEFFGPIADGLVDDATAPDLPVGSLDVITSSLVLFVLPDPSAALQQGRNPMVADGRIGVATFGPYDQQVRYTLGVAPS